MEKNKKAAVMRSLLSVIKHCILIISAFLALFPVYIVVINSAKARLEIFNSPYIPPTPDTWDLVGYDTVFARSDFVLYYKNSLTVMIVSVILILILSSFVAHALTEYKFRCTNFLKVYFMLGMVIPIRLGAVGILRIMKAAHLTNSLWALILVYTVAGMPLAVFIMTQFFSQIPSSLKEAARIDGASEFSIYTMCCQLSRPAIASVAALSISPIWNDIWWPLILASDSSVMTVTLGAQQFMGQFSADWNALLAALSMAIVPLIIFYVLFSKYVMSGTIDGALKG